MNPDAYITQVNPLVTRGSLDNAENPTGIQVGERVLLADNEGGSIFAMITTVHGKTFWFDQDFTTYNGNIWK